MTTLDNHFHVEQVTAESFLCRFHQSPSPELTQNIIALSTKLNDQFKQTLTDHIIAYNTLLLTFRHESCQTTPVQKRYRKQSVPQKQALDHQKILQSIKTAFFENQKNNSGNTQTHTHNSQSKIHRIPVCYNEQLGPDLRDLAAHTDLAIDDIIQRHTANPYHVYATGFQPGFAFLGFVDESIAMPRLATPRQTLAPGSVGIADRQTGIYPRSSPAGWRIIGRTPQDLQPNIQTQQSSAQEINDDVNSNSHDNALTAKPILNVGDYVQFYAISLQEFNDMIETP